MAGSRSSYPLTHDKRAVVPGQQSPVMGGSPTTPVSPAGSLLAPHPTGLSGTSAGDPFSLSITPDESHILPVALSQKGRLMRHVFFYAGLLRHFLALIIATGPVSAVSAVPGSA
jgi:hypothetical protein